MGTYYVRTPANGGNDTTGDGSTGTPWATLSKALATVSLAGGHTIKVGAGTYSENTSSTHYFLVAKVFADWVTFEPEIAGEIVIVTDDGTTANYLVRFNGSAYIRFNSIRFTPGVRKIYGAIFTSTNTDNNHLYFDGCTFDVITSVAGTSYGVLLQIDTTHNTNTVTINNCAFPVTGASAHIALRLQRLNAAATLDAITISNCTITTTGNNNPVSVAGATNILIDNCTFSCPGSSYGLIFGSDSLSAGPTTSGTVQKSNISSASSHGFLIGYTCDGVTVQDNVIAGGDICLGVKQCANVTITNNTISGGTNGTLVFKAAANSIATANTISNSGGPCIRLIAGDTGDKNSTITVNGNNRVKALGTAGIFAWGDDTADLGGCVVNNNCYSPKGTSLFGAVRADAHVNTLAELQAAWAGYGDGSNDNASRLCVSGGGDVIAPLRMLHFRGLHL